MKRWATGEKAEVEQEDIDRELFKLAREWMSMSKLRMLPGHVAKDSDAVLWKKFREHPRSSSTVKNSPSSERFISCSVMRSWDREILPERFSSWA